MAILRYKIKGKYQDYTSLKGNNRSRMGQLKYRFGNKF